MNEQGKKDIALMQLKAADDLVVGDDGFMYYWPEKLGAFTAGNLRAIADLLDERNKDWQSEVDKLCNHNPNEE